MEQLYRELLGEALELFDSKRKLCDKVGTDEWAWKLQTLEVLAGSPSAPTGDDGEQTGTGLPTSGWRATGGRKEG